ncbi:hypothetical protein BH10PAT3_BH10PAT3_5780 [soil metagenome]
MSYKVIKFIKFVKREWFNFLFSIFYLLIAVPEAKS